MTTNSTSTSKPVLAWHFLRDDGKTRYSHEVVAVGSTLSAKGELKLCVNGMHASESAIDALIYAPGWIACRVELFGDIIRGHDKLCARYRRVIAMADARGVLLHFAADCAERALSRIESPDPRSVAAVQAVRDYVSAKIDGKKLDDFRAAALNAALSARNETSNNQYYAFSPRTYAVRAACNAVKVATNAVTTPHLAAIAADAAVYATATTDAAQKQEREWQENALSKRLLELLGLEK